MEELLAALPLGILLAFTIGPVFFVLLETSVTKGFRAALLFDTGVILADIIFITIAYYSTSSLLEEIKDHPALFISGGLILLVYGIITYIKQRRDYIRDVRVINEHLHIKKVNYLNLFVKGFLLNFINIGVLGFWLGILIVFAPRFDMDSSKLFWFFFYIVLTYLIVDCIKILVAKRLRNFLTEHHIFKIKNIISIVIIIFSLFLIFQGFFPKQKRYLKDKFNELTERIVE